MGHGVVVAQVVAGLGDHRDVPLQGPHLYLRHHERRARQARLGHVRAEHPLGDDLGLYADPLPPPRLPRDGVAAVERVEAADQAGREPHEPLAAEPQLELDGQPRPPFGHLHLGRQPHRGLYLGPVVPEPKPAGLAVANGEIPLLHGPLAGVAPEAQLLYAAGVAFEAVPVAGVHPSPSLGPGNTYGWYPLCGTRTH